MSKVRYLALALLLAGCGERPLPPPVTLVPVAVSQGFPNTTPADLAHGEEVWRTSCATCHDLHHPDSETTEDWRAIVPKMGRKAHLDATASADVLRFLVAARASVSTGS